MHYLLFYEVADDYLARRGEFREAHLEKAWQAHQRGELVLGGALADPVDQAILMFEGDSLRVAEDFAKADPYVANGLIKRWYVRPWTTVVGEAAATHQAQEHGGTTGRDQAGRESDTTNVESTDDQRKD